MAIVGAGFSGLSAARHLRRIVPDARIVIVEAGRVAEGGAGRNSGFMIDLPHDLTSHDNAGGSEGRDRTPSPCCAGEAVRRLRPGWSKS